MGALQRYMEGSVPDLPTSVADVYRTMAVVEAAYEASRFAGVSPAYQKPVTPESDTYPLKLEER